VPIRLNNFNELDVMMIVVTVKYNQTQKSSLKIKNLISLVLQRCISNVYILQYSTFTSVVTDFEYFST